MAAWGQPDTADWQFEVTRVELIEIDVGAPGTEPPSNVINVPNNFRIRTHMHNAGPDSVWLHGNSSGTIEYRVENLETDLMTRLTTTTGWVVPGDSIHEQADFFEDSAAFTTTSAGTSTATSLGEGTYMLTVIVNFGADPARHRVTAFRSEVFFRVFP
jgi:hypothetical protein